MTRDPADGSYCIAPGALLGEVYGALYKRYGLTLPAGSCYMVGAGGHISGGGYGLLSRLHGLTSDWLTAVDIATVDAHGNVELRRVDRHQEPDLFRALRGAGNGNFGVITSFRFAALPAAPREVAEASLVFPWNDLSEEQFAQLLATYGEYWDTRGRDPDTWGLFVLFNVGTRGPNGRLSMHAQFCQPDGTTSDLSVLHEFFARFSSFRPVVTLSSRQVTGKSAVDALQRDTSQKPAPTPYSVTIRPWLDATLAGGASGSGIRAKYKSAYMKRTFTAAEAGAIYRFFSSGSVTAQSSVISMDSYGGAINKPGLARETAIAQRSSILKLQWQCYWRDDSEDEIHLRELDEFFTSVYTGDHVDARHQGTPWGDRYEGCYMNYPDADMLRHAYWPELFHGRDGLYPFLQSVKRRYDPNNIFHHSMSVRTT
ncbi:BBE domain-containing protein [Acidipila sp. EB88]|uniref:FAD-dependent oxidoreductase n=1 Tax=Acidipila sp. EB88 TaxID=2305226 RepID=UPI001F3629FF|nr:BBE domain-containing protein [Acidipila sp. EB88]